MRVYLAIRQFSTDILSYRLYIVKEMMRQFSLSGTVLRATAKAGTVPPADALGQSLFSLVSAEQAGAVGRIEARWVGQPSFDTPLRRLLRTNAVPDFREMELLGGGCVRPAASGPSAG